MQDRIELKVWNRYNDETCTLRMYIWKDGEVTDIIEGPMRYIIERAMLHISPDTKLRLRKVKK